MPRGKNDAATRRAVVELWVTPVMQTRTRARATIAVRGVNGRSSVCPKRLCRIAQCRAPGRQIAGRQRDCEEQPRCGSKIDGIERRHSVQETLDSPQERNCPDDTERRTRRRQKRTFAEYKP
jgi:hypothetical protein